MKFILKIGVVSALTLFVAITQCLGQALPIAKMQNVIIVQDHIELEVVAKTPFYVGANVFVLHIGDFSFDRYHQADIDNKGSLKFILSKEEYDQLQNGAPLFLSYGRLFDDQLPISERNLIAKESPDLCQNLGMFTKVIFKK